MREHREDEAKAVFEKLLSSDNYRHALTNLICIELVQKDYEKCLTDLSILERDDNDYFNDGKFRYIKYLCMHMLGIKPDLKEDEMDYMEGIIFNYDRDVVLNHISYHNKNIFALKNHIPLEKFDEREYDDRFFSNDIDINSLYDDVHDILQLEEVSSIYDYAISTKLFFRYDHVGSNINGQQHYLAVMFLTGTDRIISMYPVPSPERDYLVDKKPVFDFQEILAKAHQQKAL